MSYSSQDLLVKQQRLIEAQAELERKLQGVLGSGSLAETAIQNDLMSIHFQLAEIDSILQSSALPEKAVSVRRAELPASPTVLVTGIPPQNGIPASATSATNPRGESYYVAADGKVFPAG